jgi:hypothetical protein
MDCYEDSFTLLYVCPFCVTCPVHLAPPRSYHWNIILRLAPIMKIVVISFPPISNYLIPIKYKWFCTEWHQALPQFNLLLISSSTHFLSPGVVHKYFNFDIVSKDSLAIFMSWFQLNFIEVKHQRNTSLFLCLALNKPSYLRLLQRLFFFMVFMLYPK